MLKNKIGYILLYTIIIFFNGNVFSQDILDNIPDSLLKKSHFILLNEDYTFTIESKSKTVTEVKTDFVVLKKSNHIPEYLGVMYDEFNKISKLKVKIYDKNNKLIKKHNAKDFAKFSMAYTGVAADQGLKFFIVPDVTPPFRVEFSYKVKSGNSLLYPVWNPVSDEFQSILNANLTVVDKMGNNLRYKLFNIDKPEIIKNNMETIYKWSIKNRNYVEFEPFNNILEDYLPEVVLAPKEFKVENYEGKMKTWTSFAKWVNLLNKSQNNFTPEQKHQIKSLVKNTDSKIDKIRKIYKFLQDNVHYASIQLGIGGWKPMKTSFVHDKKYGDCKALTFYTKSMLDLAGVESFYTLVKAGSGTNRISGDFPNAHFNHAFLTIPLENDTIWLECTSQITPYGYSGSFTDDRNVLMIKNSGGELIRSKIYKAEENKNSVSVEIDLDSTGDAIMLLSDKMTGLAIERNGYWGITDKGKDKQKKWLYDNLPLSNFTILDFEIKPFTNEIIPKGSYKVKMKVKKLAKTTGNNLILKPFVLNNPDFEKLTKKSRKHNIYVRRAFELEDSVKINISQGYKLNSSVKIIKSETKFGKYSIEYQESDDSVIVKRQIIVNKGKYKASEYKEFKTFINKLLKISKKSLVFSKSK